MTRRVGAVALFLLIGCTPAAAPVAEPTGDPVLEAREVLGGPMLALAESVIAVSDGLGQARFDVSRGADMRTAVKTLSKRRDAAAAAADDAAAAAAAAPVEQAAGIVADAAEATESMLPAVEAELVYLRRIAGIDLALFDVAATWDEPGSQSEIRERLLGLSKDVAKLRPRVQKLQPVPSGCSTMKRNRLEWIGTLRTRTLALQEQANSLGGSTFDELRKTYRALPFAVEPRTADRADRQCWLQRSEVHAASQDVRGAVDELREALSR